LSTGENVAELGVKNGWLKVREGGKTSREDQEEAIDTLEQLQREAQDAKLGMWNDKDKVSYEKVIVAAHSLNSNIIGYA
jgi:staphylococcal nuclease domain-containing protein 1